MQTSTLPYPNPTVLYPTLPNLTSTLSLILLYSTLLYPNPTTGTYHSSFQHYSG